MSFAAITYGAHLMLDAAGWITGGVLLVAWTWLVVVDFPVSDESGGS